MNTIGINVVDQYAMCFEPKTIGTKGVKCYPVSILQSKDKNTNEKVYLNVDVVDWDNVFSGSVKKGDWIRFSGKMVYGTYKAKDGTVKPKFSLKPTSIVVENPFDNDKKSAAPVADDTLPF